VRLKIDKRTDFEIELEGIERTISELESSAFALPIDQQRATRFVYSLYQRASLTGKLAEFELAEKALNFAIEQIGPVDDLCFIKANLDFKFHRLMDVRQDLEIARELRNSPHGRALQADLDFQEGRYDQARERYEGVIKDNLTWDNLARLAYLKAKMGDVAGADQLYIEAEDELTAKQMRHYAWVELQRGVLNLLAGRYEKAWAHYRRAGRAYSGYWLVDEHQAELFGRQGQFDEAAALYEKVVARVPRPEFQQALGEIYELMGQPDRAQAQHDHALAGYLESAESGGVHYYHHLTDFYADVREDGAEAVRWARKDIDLRENFSTQAALAWAFYRDGQFNEARSTMNQALSSGVRDARLFFQAAMISFSAGGNGEGNLYLQMANEINPDHSSFHVHR
jgi:tetratricopeptide (TPR) repeat protein